MKPVMTMVLLLTVAAGLVTGCAQSKVAGAPSAKPPELFTTLSVGMTRGEVEGILGEPHFGETRNENKSEVWYLPPPKIREIDSPWGPGAIKIVYEQGKVITKELNRQGKY